MNSHNDVGYKTITKIYCKNEYSYLNKSSYCINELVTLHTSRILINVIGPKMTKIFFSVHNT